MKRMKSISSAASKASGKSRMCMSCPAYGNCNETMHRVCDMAFKDGFMKGYRYRKDNY